MLRKRRSKAWPGSSGKLKIIETDLQRWEVPSYEFKKHSPNAIGNWWQFQRLAQAYCQTRAGGQCFSVLLQDGARWAGKTASFETNMPCNSKAH